MHVLGISCGTPNGNSEILLKIALQEITKQLPGTTISILRISSISIPTFDPKDPWVTASEIAEHSSAPQADDRPAALDAILEADALIVASPIWNRQPAGALKYFCDKTLGPRVDAAFVKRAVEGKHAPNVNYAQMSPDERVLKPRVAGLIAVGGARSDEWTSLGLTGLHQAVFSLQARVVDQMMVRGCPFPGTILTPGKAEFEEAVRKAAVLGRNLASQMGKVYDDAKYLGDMKGACPICFLDVIVLNQGSDGGATCGTCGTCGAKGKLVKGGKAMLDLEGWPVTSILTMEAKTAHMVELEERRNMKLTGSCGSRRRRSGRR